RRAPIIRTAEVAATMGRHRAEADRAGTWRPMRAPGLRKGRQPSGARDVLGLEREYADSQRHLVDHLNDVLSDLEGGGASIGRNDDLVTRLYHPGIEHHLAARLPQDVRATVGTICVATTRRDIFVPTHAGARRGDAGERNFSGKEHELAPVGDDDCVAFLEPDV